MSALHELEQAWNDGYDAATDTGSNPYSQLIADRRQYVRDVIADSYGTICDADEQDVLTDELLDDLLDTHNAWLAEQRPCSAGLMAATFTDPALVVPCTLPAGHDGGHKTATGRTWPQSPITEGCPECGATA